MSLEPFLYHAPTVIIRKETPPSLLVSTSLSSVFLSLPLSLSVPPPSLPPTLCLPLSSFFSRSFSLHHSLFICLCPLYLQALFLRLYKYPVFPSLPFSPSLSLFLSLSSSLYFSAPSILLSLSFSFLSLSSSFSIFLSLFILSPPLPPPNV